MKKKGVTAEQIIGKLREAEVFLSQGGTVGEVSRKLSITEQTYHLWKHEYGGDRVSLRRRTNSFRSAARLQQKENELQTEFCKSLILLVSRAGIEPATY